MSLTDTPNSLRVNIGIFGKTNSGKSSLLNALTGQEFAVVSSISGTTTDPVYKTMEISGIGPVVFIDTAGFGDTTALGQQRMAKTEDAASKTDIALLLFTADSFLEEQNNSPEQEWLTLLNKKNIPTVSIINKADTLSNEQIKTISQKIEALTKEKPICVSAKNRTNLEAVKQALITKLPAHFMERTYTENLCKEGDNVLLIMPQDIQAPKGRLILPQVQILRELLDKKCIVTCCTTDKLEATLNSLKEDPHLIITDSQIFKLVYNLKPEHSLLTSFSTLLAATKGNIEQFIEGASAIDSLTENSRVLIAEACTHAPLTEDIGREKIPRWLRKKVGEKLKIDFVRGSDFPKDLSAYDLIIHCGACMFNRAYVISRQTSAKEADVPMTNYGIAIACMNDILDKVSFPH